MNVLEPFELIEMMIAENKNNRDLGEVDATVIPLQLIVEQQNNSSENINLPLVSTSGQELKDVLCHRTSVRFFDRGQIDLDDVGAMLAAATKGDQINWEAQQEKGILLQILVVAWRIDGLEPAIYQYDEKKHVLVKVGEALPQEEGHVLVLQKEFSWAPAILIVTGSLGAALHAYGSHGYRHLLTRGGAAAHNAWLAALTLGYEGSVFAGFLPKPLSKLAKVDGYKQAQLFAFAVGKPLKV
ncbi:hypothetical protein J5TS2_01590 [Brevibacillus halotolerans]|uniref:nitroreductase family protein n=1 Tax=Brevibacillus halotolerans TaxID=1507437 RepID=UPI001B0F30B0|nr:nitroreductase family protein [Brevibacillus halotolerans]GIN99490.1 hypothetical protein J5TS2_01590 [Brevibacillus halotolerans]